ncbi:hypothetical protein [Streptomyces sp. TRM68367]|uniref:hypothetical protein n=1 Tax=Streptomyces sp. TRM68367 TaxID=2758415 RepID=UPI00165C60B9|nr:hypothetical protein [Streptomyces sp. TRM68367]MBC9731182.1 hypothetical protein [Streptomyces sp. TRM68367]
MDACPERERGWDVRAFVEAATGLPTILFTTALVVVVCFWLLVAAGAARVDTFDTDVDPEAWGLGGVPVSVAFSLLTAVAWALSTGATVLVAALLPVGIAAGALRLTVPVVALVAAWRLVRRSARLLHYRQPAETGSSRPAEGIGGALTGPAPVLRDETDPHLRRVSCSGPEGSPRTRDRAA